MTAHVPPRVYWWVFIALMVLLGATVGASYIDMGVLNPIVALGIAAIKAALVALFFMHIRYGSRVSWLFAGAGLVWFAIMIILTMSDYVSRGWLAAVGR